MTTYSVVPIGSDKTLLPSDNSLAATVMVVIKNGTSRFSSDH